MRQPICSTVGSGVGVRSFLAGETFFIGGEDPLFFFPPGPSLSFAGGLRLLEVSVPEEVEDGDLDLEPEAEEEPV